MRRRLYVIPVLLLLILPVYAQQTDPSLLTVDSMFTYRTRSLGPVQWQTDGSGYLALEPSPTKKNVLDIVRYDVSTGDLAPDGAIVMAYRSNVPAISQFTLRRFDPAFADRARSWGGGIIVAGHNYGQGSSREHAALAPKYLGVHAVIARSFARIHRQNLIAQGIPPLVFEADGGKVTMAKFRIETVGDLIWFEDTEGNRVGAMKYRAK